MKRIFIFPTIAEAKAFILTEPRDPVFVGGVGMAEIAAATLRAVKAKKPQLVILAGIAGAYDRTLRRGEVVEVVTERVAGIPERYAREYETSGPDLGLPLAAGVTVSRSGDGLAAEGAGDAGTRHASDGKTRSMSMGGETRSMSAIAQCTANCGKLPGTAGMGAGAETAAAQNDADSGLDGTGSRLNGANDGLDSADGGLDSADSAQDDANSGLDSANDRLYGGNNGQDGADNTLDGGNDGQDGANDRLDGGNDWPDGADSAQDDANSRLYGGNDGQDDADSAQDGANDWPEVAGADAEVPQKENPQQELPQQELPQQSPRQAPRLEENPRQEFPQKENLPDDTLPEVENMEGAAFFAVCEALGVACCQVRAVSNYVGEPFDGWAVEQAVGNLTEKLTQIFGKDE